MKKYLITGFSGFVSKHFLDHLDTLGYAIDVHGADVNEPEFDINAFKNVSCKFSKVDLLDKEAVNGVINSFRPDYILHLASFSSVAFSWANPAKSFANNTGIFLNLLESVRENDVKCRILSVGSSEEYGNVDPTEIPLKETSDVRPVSPYAVARVSQEMLSTVYVEGYGLDIVLTRSFNHIGPGQRDTFVISSFVKKIVEITNIGTSGSIETGDLTIVRDFLDVRDVVAAYHLLLEKGEKGEVYNICSGTGTSLKEVVERIAHQAGVEIQTTQNPDLVRLNDNVVIIGDNTKIKKAVTWEINYSLNDSLKDIIDYWKNKPS